MFLKLKPRDDQFYKLFLEGSDTVCNGVKVLHEVFEDYTDVPKRLDELTSVEQAGDAVTHLILETLNQSLLPPFDREDIYRIARELDRILDHVHGTLERMVLYKTGMPTEAAKELVRILGLATGKLQSAFGLLDNLKANYNDVLDICEEIKGLENQGDHQYRKAVATLFSDGKDPIYVIKWKEIYEHLETALDHCEDVGNLLKGVALKYA